MWISRGRHVGRNGVQSGNVREKKLNLYALQDVQTLFSRLRNGLRVYFIFVYMYEVRAIWTFNSLWSRVRAFFWNVQYSHWISQNMAVTMTCARSYAFFKSQPHAFGVLPVYKQLSWGRDPKLPPWTISWAGLRTICLFLDILRSYSKFLRRSQGFLLDSLGKCGKSAGITSKLRKKKQ